MQRTSGSEHRQNSSRLQGGKYAFELAEPDAGFECLLLVRLGSDVAAYG